MTSVFQLTPCFNDQQRQEQYSDDQEEGRRYSKTDEKTRYVALGSISPYFFCGNLLSYANPYFVFRSFPYFCGLIHKKKTDFAKKKNKKKEKFSYWYT